MQIDTNGNEHDLVEIVLKHKSKFKLNADPNEGELAAFIGNNLIPYYIIKLIMAP